MCIQLFLGNESYTGSGSNIKAAKQQAASLALHNTKYPNIVEKTRDKVIPTLNMMGQTKKLGITATSELHEIATKKGVFVDFKFLEPFNFEFKHSMRMWDKKEMLGNYRVQVHIVVCCVQ